MLGILVCRLTLPKFMYMSDYKSAEKDTKNVFTKSSPRSAKHRSNVVDDKTTVCEDGN